MVNTPYHIKIAPNAVRIIKTLPSKQQKIVIKLIETLAINPRPPGVHKVEGLTGLYSEQVNQVRLIYKIEEQEILILVIK
jgi:mRNA interferase RelE/StbE